MWNEMSDEVKQVYGRDYFNKKARKNKIMIMLLSSCSICFGSSEGDEVSGFIAFSQPCGGL